MVSKSDQLRALREQRFEAIQKRQAVNKRSAAEPAPSLLTTDRKEYMRQAQTKWRDANPDINRQRAREGMRKRRAAAKET
jgi:hypothetical protein